MIQWQYYPKNKAITPHFTSVIEGVFKKNEAAINSANHTYESNKVLRILANDLVACGYEVESGKTTDKKIRVPVLFGRNGGMDKSFDADGWHKAEKTVYNGREKLDHFLG